jgi:hypothetical protein
MNMLAMAVAAAATVLLMPVTDFLSNGDVVPARAQKNINRTDIIVGDGDFNQVRPEYPSDPATERRNHTLRLQYIESLLRSRDVSDMPAELRAERMRNLDRLRNYWARGEYPVNYEHPNAWEPCFIDRTGAICAVGYLVEQSAGRELAEKIDSRYHFATIKEIDAPELAAWIARSGLTKAEVVTIQGPSLSNDIRVADVDRSLRTRIARIRKDTIAPAILLQPAPAPAPVAEITTPPVELTTTLIQPAESPAPSIE